MSTINITNIDPGEGSPLQDDNYVAVYGGTSLLDMFYPVGTYYETSDTNFDPNVSWGGVWVEDSAGRVTVARNSGTFSTVGGTGGVEKNDFSSKLYYGVSTFGYQQGSGAYADRIVVGLSRTGGGEVPYSPLSDLNNLQPYKTVIRWHRTA